MRDNYDLIYAEVDLGISRDICRLGSALSLSSDALLEAENPKWQKELQLNMSKMTVGVVLKMSGRLGAVSNCSKECINTAWNPLKQCQAHQT